MLTYAIIAFAIAAVGGLVLAASVLRNQLPSWGLSLVHAALGAIGLVLLLVTLAESEGNSTLLTGFVLMLVAALGGFFLASFHAKKKLPPKAVVVVHAVVAVIGFLTLVSLVM